MNVDSMDDVITSIEDLPSQRHSHVDEEQEDNSPEKQVCPKKIVNVIIREKHSPKNQHPCMTFSFPYSIQIVFSLENMEQYE